MEKLTKTTMDTVASNFGDDLYNSIKGTVRKLGHKFNADFTIKLEEYFKFSVDKIGKVKTLFYDTKAQPLRDFYEPIKVETEDEVYDTSSISNLMKNEKNILFTGIGGCGKTMLLKYLFLNSISEEYKIPVYNELRKLNSYSGTLIDFIYESITEMHFDISVENFEYSLKGNKYVFLFDALDEVYPDKVEILSKEILSLASIDS